MCQDEIKCFQIISSSQGLRALRIYIDIEKPYEELYMINVIDLHIVTQYNMHASKDVFLQFHDL